MDILPTKLHWAIYYTYNIYGHPILVVNSEDYVIMIRKIMIMILDFVKTNPEITENFAASHFISSIVQNCDIKRKKILSP